MEEGEWTMILKWNKFMNGLTAAERGNWTRHRPDMRSKAFQSRNICFIKGEGAKPFIQEEERIVLINMVQHCERMNSVKGITYPKFNARQMKTAIADTDELLKMTTFIDSLRQDMRHNPNVVPTRLQMSRRYGGSPVPPPFRPENDRIEDSLWILFLNDDYKGGEIWFPTRKIAVNPKAGCIIRFPTGIPYGRTAVSDGYQFTLEGENTPVRGDEEKWGDVIIH